MEHSKANRCSEDILLVSSSPVSSGPNGQTTQTIKNTLCLASVLDSTGISNVEKESCNEDMFYSSLNLEYADERISVRQGFHEDGVDAPLNMECSEAESDQSSGEEDMALDMECSDSVDSSAQSEPNSHLTFNVNSFKENDSRSLLTYKVDSSNGLNLQAAEPRELHYAKELDSQSNNVVRPPDDTFDHTDSSHVVPQQDRQLYGRPLVEVPVHGQQSHFQYETLVTRM